MNEEKTFTAEDVLEKISELTEKGYKISFVPKSEAILKQQEDIANAKFLITIEKESPNSGANYGKGFFIHKEQFENNESRYHNLNKQFSHAEEAMNQAFEQEKEKLAEKEE